MLNVLKKAFPGAVVVTIQCLTIFCFRHSLNIDPDTISTMSIVVAAFTCLMVLYRTCNPFNNYRRFIYGTMFVGYLACIFLGPLKEYFEILPLDVPQILLVLLLIVLSNTLLDLFTKIPAMIYSSVIEKLRFKRLRIILVEKEHKTTN